MITENAETSQVIVIDDEESILYSIDTTLRAEGFHNIITCQDSRNALQILKNNRAQVILLDLTMPHVSGQKLLETITNDYAGIPVIIITGTIEVESAVQCIKQGAFDYLVKPIEAERLLNTIKQALSFCELQKENRALKESLLQEGPENPDMFTSIVTGDHKMFAIFKYIEAIAGTSQVVLITGETGVGKEMIASTIHTMSGLRGRYVPVNIAGLDDVNFTDTLFGHIKGAFTGADSNRQGLVEKAAGGTLVLDEIGDLSLASQVKLLRFLQESEYRALGMDDTRKADVRVIAATNKDLNQLKKDNSFRKDLLYRLQTHHIHIPPLRERLDDMPLLLNHFLQQAAKTFGCKKPSYPKELVNLLQTYSFPGNIRELKSMIFDAVSRHESKMLSMAVFQRYLESQNNLSSQKSHSVNENKIHFPTSLPTIEETNRELLVEALKRAGGNQSIVARMLGITQQAVSKRLKKLKIPPDQTS